MSWERELKVLEEAIRRLNTEYDAFLYGTGARPPVQSRRHVEEMIRRLSAATFEAAADQYRFTMLQGRYVSLGERWERLQDEKESGRRPGLYGHFAPGGGGVSRGSGPAAPAASASLNGTPASSVDATKAGARAADRQLFETYLGARKARGENVSGYDFEKFADSLSRERARLKEQLGTEDVLFEVAERDGRVKLIAKRGEAGAAGGSGEKK